MVLVVVFCNQLLPSLLFNRTRGRWVRAHRLAHPPAALAHDAHHRLRPLLLLRRLAGRGAGQPRGGDRRRCRGAARSRRRRGHPRRERPRPGPLRRRVRRQAGPRGHDPAPRGLCRPRAITLEHFLELLREHNFSRVPVYSGSLDNVTGIAFAHDLLQISDEEARTRTVASIQRPAVFVPETKRGYELLREMQREKQHMRIVIDEYGGVAGLVTIEDLLGADRRQHQGRARGRNAHRRAAARARRRLARSRQLSRRSVARPLRRAAGLEIWAKPTKPPRSAAWSARSRAASRSPARSCCSNPSACAWKSSPPPTAASSASASSRPPQSLCMNRQTNCHPERSRSHLATCVVEDLCFGPQGRNEFHGQRLGETTNLARLRSPRLPRPPLLRRNLPNLRRAAARRRNLSPHRPPAAFPVSLRCGAKPYWPRPWRRAEPGSRAHQTRNRWPTRRPRSSAPAPATASPARSRDCPPRPSPG